MDDCSGAVPWPGDAEEQGQEVAEVQLAGGADTGAGAGEESGPGEQAGENLKISQRNEIFQNPTSTTTQPKITTNHWELNVSNIAAVSFVQNSGIVFLDNL